MQLFFLAFSFLAVFPLEKNTCPRTLSPARQDIEFNCISGLAFTGNIAIRNALFTLSNLPELLAHFLRFFFVVHQQIYKQIKSKATEKKECWKQKYQSLHSRVFFRILFKHTGIQIWSPLYYSRIKCVLKSQRLNIYPEITGLSGKTRVKWDVTLIN